MYPKNIRARIVLPVNGAVIHDVRPVVDRATMEWGKIIPRQHVARLENRDKGNYELSIMNYENGLFFCEWGRIFIRDKTK